MRAYSFQPMTQTAWDMSRSRAGVCSHPLSCPLGFPNMLFLKSPEESPQDENTGWSLHEKKNNFQGNFFFL